MIAEAIRAIGQNALEGASAKSKVHFERLAGMAPDKIMKIAADGATEILTLDPSPRQHQLESVGEIGDFIAYAIGRLHATPSIWMSPDCVTILLFDEKTSNCRDRATVALTKTPQFDTLENWEDDPERFSHVKFLKMLRRQFSTNILNLRDLLMTLQRVTTQDGKTITSEATRSRASIGASIVKELKLDAGELPETIPDMSVIPYDDPAFGQKYNITCMLDVDEDGSFALVPLTGQCGAIIDTTMVALRDLIVDHVPEGTPIIYGQP